MRRGGVRVVVTCIGVILKGGVVGDGPGWDCWVCWGGVCAIWRYFGLACRARGGCRVWGEHLRIPCPTVAWELSNLVVVTDQGPPLFVSIS